jgi:hypothetical protein
LALAPKPGRIFLVLNIFNSLIYLVKRYFYFYYLLIISILSLTLYLSEQSKY